MSLNRRYALKAHVLIGTHDPQHEPDRNREHVQDALAIDFEMAVGAVTAVVPVQGGAPLPGPRYRVE